MPTLPERWLPIPGWPYEVSNKGQVRSLPVLRKAGRAGWRWTKSKILKRTVYNFRATVSLHNEKGEQWTAGVANLVLRVFDRPPQDWEVARHYHDPDPLNCNLWNLRWGSQADNVSDEARQRGGHHKKGVPHTEETKAKIGAAHMGMKHSEEAKAKMKEAAKSRPPISEHTRELLRQRRHTMETKAKIAAANLQHKHSEETKAKMAASARIGWLKRKDQPPPPLSSIE